MSATVLDELLEALQAVQDLDALQQLVASNDVMDRGSPPLRNWLLDLINTERRRRESGGSSDYPIADFSTFSYRLTMQNANLSVIVVEASLLAGSPTMQQFAMRLCQLMVGLLGITLLEVTENHATRQR